MATSGAGSRNKRHRNNFKNRQMEEFTPTENRKEVEENKGMVSVHFDSITDFMECKPPAKHQERFDEHTKNRTDRNGSWFGKGNKKASDVINKALLGDPYLYGALSSYIAELDKLTGYYTKDYEQVIEKVKRVHKRDFFGDELDIHKVYQGQLDTAWHRTERVEVASKFHLVTLLIDVGGHSGQNAIDSIWRAAIVVKLVRELEQAGKAVRIVSGFAVEGAIKANNKLLTATITIKDYNQTLTLERLAAMSHFGFMRTFCFGAFYYQEYPLYGSLGRPIDMTSKHVPIQLQKEVDAGHTKYVYIGRAMDSSSALKFLKHGYEQMEEFSKES